MKTSQCSECQSSFFPYNARMRNLNLCSQCLDRFETRLIKKKIAEMSFDVQYSKPTKPLDMPIDKPKPNLPRNPHVLKNPKIKKKS